MSLKFIGSSTNPPWSGVGGLGHEGGGYCDRIGVHTEKNWRELASSLCITWSYQGKVAGINQKRSLSSSQAYRHHDLELRYGCRTTIQKCLLFKPQRTKTISLGSNWNIVGKSVSQLKRNHPVTPKVRIGEHLENIKCVLGKRGRKRGLSHKTKTRKGCLGNCFLLREILPREAASKKGVVTWTSVIATDTQILVMAEMETSNYGNILKLGKQLVAFNQELVAVAWRDIVTANGSAPGHRTNERPTRYTRVSLRDHLEPTMTCQSWAVVSYFPYPNECTQVSGRGAVPLDFT